MRFLGSLLFVMSLFALACGGESSDESSKGDAGGAGGAGGSTGGSGGGTSSTCVGDIRSPSGCGVTWELLDTCPMLQPTMTLEVAVFDGGCPDDATMLQGATATAIHRAAFKQADPFPPVTGLSQKSYGFAFIARDVSCSVTAFGCTDADLANISQIKTAVCDWSSSDLLCACKALTNGGGCPLPETCSSGTCSGAT